MIPQPLAVMSTGRVLATPIDPSESIIGVPKLEISTESESARNSTPQARWSKYSFRIMACLTARLVSSRGTSPSPVSIILARVSVFLISLPRPIKGGDTYKNCTFQNLFKFWNCKPFWKD